jgi:hypothetical protein
MISALRSSFAALLLFTATAGPALAQLPAPSPTAPIFEQKNFGPWGTPTPPPPTRLLEQADRKPIPREWIIGGAVAATVVALLLFWGASRAWRSSNLFDQQYRFPIRGGAAVALRLGGKKSGGHMASISLPASGEKAPRAAAPNETR